MSLCWCGSCAVAGADDDGFVVPLPEIPDKKYNDLYDFIRKVGNILHRHTHTHTAQHIGRIYSRLFSPFLYTG